MKTERETIHPRTAKDFLPLDFVKGKKKKKHGKLLKVMIIKPPH